MGFLVDPDGLRQVGESVVRAGAAADAELRRTHAGTARGGVGLGLDAAHQELTALAAEALDLVAAALARSGAGTRAMADTYESADATAGDGFRGSG